MSSDLLKMQVTRQFGADQLEPLQKRFQRIDESVQQITSLLDDVLTVNRSDTGKVEIHPEQIELESFCEAILQEIQVAASAEHVIRSPFVGAATSIRSDGQFLRQILTNLLSNAVKYSPDGGKVLLDVHCEPEWVEFRFKTRASVFLRTIKPVCLRCSIAPAMSGTFAGRVWGWRS